MERTATSDQGPKLSSPHTVEGKVSEKATTPSAARRVPRAGGAEAAAAGAAGAVEVPVVIGGCGVPGLGELSTAIAVR
ncbi:hypothetical protein GCM10010272_20200 [Streptomyces lateritius]|nr:hypothetical protein GCM10010272_20200 [Streptomyces lateritius]